MAGNVYGGVTSGGAGVRILIEPPFEFIERQLGKLRRDLGNFDTLWDLVEPVMAEIEAEVFATRGHGQWPALADSTIRQKQAGGYPLDPLVRTGDLKGQLTNPAAAAQRSGDSMSYGTGIAYAHWHQDGGTTPGRPPQRKIIDIEDVDARRKVEAAVVTWINEVVSRNWRI